MPPSPVSRAICVREPLTTGTRADVGLVGGRELFKAAILANAAVVICVHNYPSGAPTPSVEDRRIAERTVRTPEVLGVPILDHIVIGAIRSTPLQTPGTESSASFFRESPNIHC